MSRQCQVCQKPSQLRCSRCRVVYYCSADHQRTDWRKHKDTCGRPVLVAEQEDNDEEDDVELSDGQQFLQATRTADAEAMQLLASRVDGQLWRFFDERNERGNTFLHFLCANPSFDFFSRFFDTAELRPRLPVRACNEAGSTPLHYAALTANLPMIEYLLHHFGGKRTTPEAQIPPSGSVTEDVAECESAETAAEVQPLSAAAEGERRRSAPDNSDILAIEDGRGETPFDIAIARQQREVCERFSRYIEENRDLLALFQEVLKLAK